MSKSRTEYYRESKPLKVKRKACELEDEDWKEELNNYLYIKEHGK